ncbi:MAG: O-antigen ligase family protein [Burkholderiaceae bacterium]
MVLLGVSPAAALMDAAAFLLLSLALSLRSGYSLGAVLLLALGLLAWPHVLAGRVRWSLPLAAWAGAVALMGAVWGMHIVDANGHLVTDSLGLDRCVKYLGALLILPALLVRRPTAAALRWGCALGAIGAGLTALWQLQMLKLDRAEGYTNAIQFGNLALLLALCSGIWVLQARPPRLQAVIGWAGVVMGLTASLASASRGGWVMLPPLMLLILWLQRAPNPAPAGRRALRAVLVTAAVSAVLATLPVVQQRAELAADELQQHAQQGAGTSVGLRVAFWRQAWLDGLEHPWVGVGQLGYEQRQRDAVAQGSMPALATHYNHAHNEWLDLFAKRGLLGVLGLLLFYGVPGVCFWRALRQAGADTPEQRVRRAAALCGLVTVLGYIGFGMTQVMFAHNNGNLMYLLTVSLWLAVSWHGAGARPGAAAS